MLSFQMYLYNTWPSCSTLTRIKNKFDTKGSIYKAIHSRWENITSPNHRLWHKISCILIISFWEFITSIYPSHDRQFTCTTKLYHYISETSAPWRIKKGFYVNSFSEMKCFMYPKCTCIGVLSADNAVKPTMSLKYIVTQS